MNCEDFNKYVKVGQYATDRERQERGKITAFAKRRYSTGGGWIEVGRAYFATGVVINGQYVSMSNLEI